MQQQEDLKRHKWVWDWFIIMIFIILIIRDGADPKIGIGLMLAKSGGLNSGERNFIYMNRIEWYEYNLILFLK